ncbi:MAG: hypothetical protein Q8O56_09010, partial [Solirubrobacteraceae bacterium]|nr:hypothetical protein [Solirubrobacteraceae bacterium]
MRTVIVAICGLLAGAAAVLGATSLFGTPDPRPIAPIEVRTASQEPDQTPAQRERERRARERRRAERARSGGFERAPRPTA